MTTNDPGRARRVRLLDLKRRHAISYQARIGGAWDVTAGHDVIATGLPDLRDCEEAVLRRFGEEP